MIAGCFLPALTRPAFQHASLLLACTNRTLALPAGRGPAGCEGPSADQVLHPVQVCPVAAGRRRATERQGGGQRPVCIAFGGRAAVLVLWEPCRGGVLIVIVGMTACCAGADLMTVSCLHA